MIPFVGTSMPPSPVAGRNCHVTERTVHREKVPSDCLRLRFTILISGFILLAFGVSLHFTFGKNSQIDYFKNGTSLQQLTNEKLEASLRLTGDLLISFACIVFIVSVAIFVTTTRKAVSRGEARRQSSGRSVSHSIAVPRTEGEPTREVTTSRAGSVFSRILQKLRQNWREQEAWREHVAVYPIENSAWNRSMPIDDGPPEYSSVANGKSSTTPPPAYDVVA